MRVRLVILLPWTNFVGRILFDLYSHAMYYVIEYTGVFIMKSSKISIYLLAVIGLFLLSVLHNTFHPLKYSSLLTQSIIYAGTKTTVSSIATKQKNIKLFEMISPVRMRVAICFSATAAIVNEIEEIYIAKNLHPYSNKAPPV